MVHNKTILITGCSSGIGRCVAVGLKKRGYRVFATARKIKDVEQLRQAGFKSLQLDLSEPESIQLAVAQLLECTDGQLYALFNNGGYGQPGAVEDLRREILREQFETNVFGVHELTRMLLPTMRRQGYGRIIQNSSVLGFTSLPYRAAYIASKFALEGLSDTLRLELSGTGIYVSIIEPGPIVSRFRANAYEMFKRNIDKQGSSHHEEYKDMEKRFTAKGPVAPFTLPPEAVLRKVIHALESPKPKIRYYVTVPTYFFAILRRVLPWRALDYVFFKVGQNERKARN